MQQQKIIVKGMVCHRCIAAVKNELESLGIQSCAVTLGEVTLPVAAVLPAVPLLEEKLGSLGFSLLENKNRAMVVDLKKLVAEVYSGNYDFPYRFRFALLAAERLRQPYDFISSVFSREENISIENYIIRYRVEQAKTLLVKEQASMAEISFRLGFSSVPHLSRQFKMQTGVTPAYFKNLRQPETTA